MLGYSVQRGVNGGADGDLPVRQNRRSALIETALQPARERVAPAELDILTSALALIIGTESMVVLKDVLQLDEAAAGEVRQWAIRALVEAALKDESALTAACHLNDWGSDDFNHIAKVVTFTRRRRAFHYEKSNQSSGMPEHRARLADGGACARWVSGSQSPRADLTTRSWKARSPAS